jgi:hypothetical protein
LTGVYGTGGVLLHPRGLNIDGRTGEPADDHIDMAEFAQFVVEDLYEKGELDETGRVFDC